MNFPEKWPVYYKDSLIIGDPTMDTAVVTLWTPKEMVAERLNMSKVNAVGQLYTKRGINFLVRNVLANPVIRKIYVLGADLSGSGEALLKNNYDIDKEVSSESFQSFKQNVKLVDNRKFPAYESILGEESIPWAKSQIFPSPRVHSPEFFPSEFSAIVVRAENVSKAWPEILKNLLMFGITSKPVIHYDQNGSDTLKELPNLVVVVSGESDSLDNLELTKADVNIYVENFFSKECIPEDYTYGERLFNYDGFDQIDRMIKKLKKFPQDKGALAVLWKPKEDSFPSYKSMKPKRVPCLTCIQCQVWENKLYMTAYFRSNDMGSAWPLNAFALQELQKRISGELNTQIGSLTTISNMAQLYSRDYKLAQDVIKKTLNKNVACQFDPRGNLIIKVEGNIIKVTQLSPDGRTELSNWEQVCDRKDASRFLGDRILSDLAISQVSHAMDIGRQLARAEEACRRGLKFTQDQPLSLK